MNAADPTLPPATRIFAILARAAPVGVAFELPHTDWADFDDGDLVFAKEGCLPRLSRKSFARYAEKGRKC